MIRTEELLHAGQVFAFTAPNSLQQPQNGSPLSWYSRKLGFDFTRRHGLGVRAVGKPAKLPHCVKH